MIGNVGNDFTGCGADTQRRAITMPKVNAEAELAVKLYATKQRILARLSDKFTVHIGDDPDNQHDAGLNAAKLMTISRSLGRLYTAYCNRVLSDKEVRRMERLEDTAFNILKQEYGLESEHDRDPRGYSLYIHFPDGSSNSWGGSEKGWGI